MLVRTEYSTWTSWKGMRVWKLKIMNIIRVERKDLYDGSNYVGVEEIGRILFWTIIRLWKDENMSVAQWPWETVNADHESWVLIGKNIFFFSKEQHFSWILSSIRGLPFFYVSLNYKNKKTRNTFTNFQKRFSTKDNYSYKIRFKKLARTCHEVAHTCVSHFLCSKLIRK